MLVCPGLVLTGEIQVDIRHLTAAVAQKRLKGDVKSVLSVLCPAHRTILIGHIRAAAVAAIGDELSMAAFGAAIMGRQGVHLRNAGHIRHQRGPHTAPAAHQITVFQAALHQLLGGHIHHVVLAQNAFQFHVQPVHDQLRRLVAIQLVTLVPHSVMKFLLRILQPRREQPSRRQQLDIFDTVGDAARVVDDHPMRFLFAQIGKLRQHLLRGLEVNGQGCVGVGKLLAGQ